MNSFLKIVTGFYKSEKQSKSSSGSFSQKVLSYSEIFDHLEDSVYRQNGNLYVIISIYVPKTKKLRVFKTSCNSKKNILDNIPDNFEFDPPDSSTPECEEFYSGKLTDSIICCPKFIIDLIGKFPGTNNIYSAAFTKNKRLLGSIHILGNNKLNHENLEDVENLITEVTNILYKKKSERILINREKKYRFLAENSNDLIWVFDNEQKIHYVSPSVVEITGFSSKEFLNMSFQQIFGAGSYEEIIAKISFLTKGSRSSRQEDLSDSSIIELDILHKTRGYISTESNIKPVYDKDLNISAFHVISRDITKKKKIEKHQKEFEDRNNILINNLPIGLAVFTSEQKIIFANPLFYELLNFIGKNAESITDLAELELFNRTEFLNPLKKLINESVSFDIEVLADKIENYYLRIRGYSFPAYSNDKQSYLLLLSNISSQKIFAEKLQRSEERFRDIYKQSPVGIELYDETGNLFDSNPAALEMFGIGHIEDAKIFNLFNNKDFPEWAKKTLLQGNTTRFRLAVDFESLKKNLKFRTKMSGVLYLDILAVPLKYDNLVKGYLLQFFNITDQMLAEEIIEKMKLAFEQTADGIVITDLEGSIQFVNKSWCDFHGYNESELIGNSITIFHAEDDLYVNKVLLYKSIIDSGFRQVEISHKTKEGGFIDLRITGTLMKDAHGKSLGVIEIAQNITEEKKEQKLRAALFEISELLYKVKSINDLYISIHDIVKKLMPAENFYIANYDKKTDTITFPYFIDEKDSPPGPRKSKSGLTEYVLKTGQSMLVSPEKFTELSKINKISGYGYLPIDWLGVPLKSSNKVIGVMAVQSYHEGVRYSEDDKYILDFLSSQVVMVIERKEAEHSLLESESKFRYLAETLSVGIFIHHVGKIFYTNPAFEDLTGYSLEEIPDRDFANIVCPEFREQFNNKVNKHLAKKHSSDRYEFQIITKSGEIKWLDYFSNLIEYDGNLTILSTISDHTERKVYEEKLKLAKLMIENSPNIIFRIKSDQDWTVDFVSENITRFGYLPEELFSGMITFKSIIHPDDRQKVTDRVQTEILRGTLNFSMQFRIIAKNNKMIWIDSYFSVQKEERGNIIHYQCVVQDISEKKLAEESLRTTEEMLKKLIENSEYLVILQDLTGKYIYFNGLYQYGTDGNSLIGKTPSDVLSKEVANEIMNRVANVIDSNQVVNAENKIFWAGRELWFLDHSYPVHDLEGNIIAVGTISVDITERKRYEIKIVDSEKKLREANATKERIFSIIRHDIMGPLGALKNLTEMIYNKPQMFDAEESKDVIKAIKESSTSIFDLISTLLSWANSQNVDAMYHPMTYSLNEIVNDCVQLLSPMAINKNIKLWSDINTALNGYFDKIMITTVIRNIISNALKFTNPNGEVVISATSDSTFISVSIKDNGIGIKPEHTKKLFDIDSKFSTIGTGNEKGTGLGLNLCKNFINRNGGEIWMASEPGAGSTFYFTLPLSKEIIKPTLKKHGFVHEYDFSDKMILLVDDENINLKVIEEYLAPTHIRLLYARDGTEAIKVFKAQPKIDLILIDLLMPEMDGFEATQIIRKLNPNITIIAQTSFDLDEHKKKFRQAGGTDYMVKPIIRKNLLETLNKYLFK